MKQLIKKTVIVFSLLASVVLYAETPNEGAAVIRDLIKEKKYDVLFPSRYSEWHKTEKEGVGQDEAIRRLSTMFEKKHELFLSLYEQLAESEFTISDYDYAQVTETGKVATAMVEFGAKKVPFKLYEMKNGTWGFHL